MRACVFYKKKIFEFNFFKKEIRKKNLFIFFYFEFLLLRVSRRKK
jgi:hypothetical protein